MRFLRLIALQFFVFHASTSFSKGADVCEDYEKSPELPRCYGKNCPTLFHTSPSQFKSLKLVAACNYQVMDGSRGKRREVGAFVFRGDQIISGTLRREPSEFINEFTLRGKEKTIQPETIPVFFRHEVYLQFPEAREAEKKFGTPKPSKGAPCWEAKVKLKITEMHSVFGWDNTEGDYPRRYRVLDVGPYRKCLTPTPDPFAQ